MALFRKKIKDSEASGARVNTPMLDLRKYTPEALKKIQKLNCAILITPVSAAPELIAAYAQIPQKNIAAEISTDKEICFVNGSSVLDGKTCRSDAFYIINGICVIKNGTQFAAEIVVNGKVVYDNGCAAFFRLVNGKKVVVDFNIEHTLDLGKKAELNADLIRNLKENTVITVEDEAQFSADITPDMLRGKNLFFVAAEIKCPEQLVSVLQLMSAADKIKKTI